MPPLAKTLPALATVILAALLIRLFTSGMSWVGVTALMVAIVWFGFELVRWIQSERERKHLAEEIRAAASSGSENKAEEENADLVSLVYFLSEPRAAEETSIRQCVSDALGMTFELNNPDSEFFVMQFSPPDVDGDLRHFMVRLPQGVFAILVSPHPYIDQPRDFARESIRDKRLRQAVESHLAWISVDLMSSPDEPGNVSESYRIIGKILAALAGPDCLAIYCPSLRRCNEFDLTLIDALKGPTPLDLFDEPTFEPIIEVADNNPRMAAAVKEAVRRWPEFEKAFRSREEEESDHFIIKAEFREGKTCEYMWVSVQEIQDGVVFGILMNDPHELLEVHRGAPVRIRLDRLNDWIFPNSDGSHTGGFTLDVLAEDEEQ